MSVESASHGHYLLLPDGVLEHQQQQLPVRGGA
jgi:hypothetical protein